MPEWTRLNAPDPLSSVDCWCPDAFIENNDTVEYCPRHGDKPDWELVEGGPDERARQQAVREANR